MPHRKLIPHLFREEFQKMVSVLCSTYGLSNIQLAEDVVSETFLKASETWSFKGLPDNPRAWLYTVAKNQLKDQLKRHNLFRDKIGPELQSSQTVELLPNFELSGPEFKDQQLQMMFAICHPSLPEGGQLALALRVLCGFGIQEIAQALLSNSANINKKLQRSKKQIREQNFQIEFPMGAELEERLDRVLLVLYLLFNEGYYSSVTDKAIRKDLCFEAIRLTYLLTINANTQQPKVYALLALFCFHASRFEARMGEDGLDITYEEQDRSLWNTELIQQGMHFLRLSVGDAKPSRYHLEALIAREHAGPEDDPKKWFRILSFYNQLLQLHYSPALALSRTYAYGQVHGKEAAREELHKLGLVEDQYFYAVLAALYEKGSEAANSAYQHAAAHAANEREKSFYLRQISKLSDN